MTGDIATPGERPNVIVVLADDMGYSDIGCYGGEIDTPHLDRLADEGVRMSQFYNTARCSPSRASLLTGLHPHQTGIGILVDDDRPEGYAGSLNDRCVTIAEVLGRSGYVTYLAGKWHVSNDPERPNDAWPTRRGFQQVYGTMAGAGSYFAPYTLTRGEERIDGEANDPAFFYTDAISDAAAGFITDHAAERGGEPFFLYAAYTAPHWPLHALPEDIERYRGRFDEGWDVLRQRRARRLIELGVLDESWTLTDRDADEPAWEDEPDHGWQASRMEVYAAQVTRMDAGIGRIVAALRDTGRLDDTLLIFLSDNGASAEELPRMDLGGAMGGIVPELTRDGTAVRFGNAPDVVPGPEDTYASYGRAWANLSNTPFREYKTWVHEGGIATPFIVRWPGHLAGTGVVRHERHHLPDIMATVLDAAGVAYPDAWPGRRLLPLEGTSMLPTLRAESSAAGPFCWEHEGNAAVRDGPWKLVRTFPGDWELYDTAADRTELRDLAGEHPDVVAELADRYHRWADRCGVLPRERVLELYRARRRGLS